MLTPEDLEAIRQIVRQELAAKKRKPPSEMVGADEIESAGAEARHAREWLAVRKAKSLPLTRTAWEQMQDEAKKAGIEVREVIRICCGMSWAGFKASWMDKVSPELKPLPQKRNQADEWMKQQDALKAELSKEQLQENARRVREQIRLVTKNAA